MLLTEFNSSRHAKVIEVHEDEAGTNPMAQAVTRRIMNQHPEWLMKYGPEAVMQAIDDVTEGDTDWEEIGSSDVSAYVTYVGDALRDRAGSREESVEEGIMDTLKGAAKEFTRDSLQKKIKQAWENTFWPKHIEPALNRIQIDGQPFRRMVLGEPRVIENDRSKNAILKQYTVNIVFPIDPQQWAGDEIKYLEAQLRDIEDGDWNPKVHGLGLVSFDQPMKSFQYAKGSVPDLVIPVRITSLDINRSLVGEQGVAEGLRDGEYHVATVTLDDGTEKKVNLMSDEGFRDQIEKHFAKQGRQVKDIKVDWGIHANESNDRPLAFVAPSKNTNLGYIKLIAHKVKNNKPVSRREKEDLSKYLASNMMKEDEHGDLRTGWIAKAAKRAFPMAGSDMEALAMWINDRLEKDVARLDKENDREDRDINRLDRENDLEQTMIDRLDQRDGNVDDRLDKIEKTLSQKSMEGSYFSTKANAEEISKYLAEMKNDGYDI